MRRASRERRVLIEVFEGIVRGIAKKGGVWMLAWLLSWRGRGCGVYDATRTVQLVPRLGTMRGINLLLLPDTVLTKICIVSSDSELEELMLLMLDVRRMVAGLKSGGRGDGVVASGDDAGRGDLVG